MQPKPLFGSVLHFLPFGLVRRLARQDRVPPDPLRFQFLVIEQQGSQRFLGDLQERLPLPAPMLGKDRAVADDEPLAGIVRAADFSQMALIEQRELNRLTLGQTAEISLGYTSAHRTYLTTLLHSNGAWFVITRPFR